MLDAALVVADINALGVSALGTSGVGLPWQFFLAPVAGGAAILMAVVFTNRAMRRSENDPEQGRIARDSLANEWADSRQPRKVGFAAFAALLAAFCILRFGLGIQTTGSTTGVVVALLLGLFGYMGAATAAGNSLRAGPAVGLLVSGIAVLTVSIWFWLLTRFGGLLGLTGHDGDGAGSVAHRLAAMSGIILSLAVGSCVYALLRGNRRGIAGTASHFHTSSYASVLAAIALGATAGAGMLTLDTAAQSLITVKLAVLPLALAGVGILCALLGLLAFRGSTPDGSDASTGRYKASRRAVWLAAGLLLPGSLALLYSLFRTSPEIQWLGLWGTVVVGALAAIVLSAERRHRRSGTDVDALAAGMLEASVPLLTIGVCIPAAYRFGIGTADNPLLGLYGIALAAVAMLGTLSLTLVPQGADRIVGAPDDQPAAPSVTSLSLATAAIAALALSGTYLTTIQASLAAHARAFVASHPTNISASDQSGPHAIYMGNGVFASVVPGAGVDGAAHTDALMLIDRTQLPTDGAFRDVVRAGHRFVLGAADSDPNIDDPFLLAESRTLLVSTILTHGEPGSPGAHEHAISLEVIAASRASTADLFAHYDATLLNPRVMCGLVLGTLVTFLYFALSLRRTGTTAHLWWPAAFPALLATGAPGAAGLFLGVAGAMGVMVGTIVSALGLGTMLMQFGRAQTFGMAHAPGVAAGVESPLILSTSNADVLRDQARADSILSLCGLMTLVPLTAIFLAWVTVRFGTVISAWLGLQ